MDTTISGKAQIQAGSYTGAYPHYSPTASGVYFMEKSLTCAFNPKILVILPVGNAQQGSSSGQPSVVRDSNNRDTAQIIPLAYLPSDYGTGRYSTFLENGLVYYGDGNIAYIKGKKSGNTVSWAGFYNTSKTSHQLSTSHSLFNDAWYDYYYAFIG